MVHISLKTSVFLLLTHHKILEIYFFFFFSDGVQCYRFKKIIKVNEIRWKGGISIKWNFSQNHFAVTLLLKKIASVSLNTQKREPSDGSLECSHVKVLFNSNLVFNRISFVTSVETSPNICCWISLNLISVSQTLSSSWPDTLWFHPSP